MNCKPGDLAVVVRVTDSTAHVLGVLVHVIEAGPLRFYSEAFGVIGEQATWVCELDRPTANWRGYIGTKFVVPDFTLRPLRDGEGEDETLTWAPVPQKVTA